MGFREIWVSDWESFLAEFNRSHRAWLTTVERTDRAGTRVEARARSLDAVEGESAAGRVVAIVITLDSDAEHPAALRVEAPVRISVDETVEGQVRGVEIEDAQGTRTRLTFRTAPPLEALDGIAPGEVG